MAVRPTLSIGLCLGLVVVGLTGCPEFSRGKFYPTYELPGDTLLAPSLSRYLQSDGVVDCAPGETELDYGMLFRSQTFSPSFQESLRFQLFAACTPGDGARYFVEKPPETVYQIGDDLGGFTLANAFELRLAGRWAMTAGAFTDGTNGIVVSERTGVGSWTHTKVLGTGSTIGTATYNSITGVDFKWTGSKVGLALTYVDTSFNSRLAYCPDFVCANVFGPGSIAGAVDYFSPRIGGAEPDVFLAFQTSAVQFAQPTRLNYTDLAAQPSAQVIAEIGSSVPDLPGETFGSFGNFTSHQAGLGTGAFTATTSPSNFRIALKYDVTNSLALSLEYKEDDELPDTTRVGVGYFNPAFDGDALSMRVQTNFANSVFVSEIPSGGGFVRVGTARATTDAQREGALQNLQVSNESIVDGISAFQGELSTVGGTVPIIGIQNLEDVEVVRGKPATVYGADAVAGVVNFVTRSGSGPDGGFDVEVKGTSFKDFGGATFDTSNDLYLGARLSGSLYRYNRTTDDVDLIGDTGIGGGFAGLARDGSGGFYAIDTSSLYRFDGVNFPATLIGSIQDGQAQPITDFGGLHYGDGTLYAARQGGEIGELDPLTATYTPQFQIVGLPGALMSLASDDAERVFGGLDDGRLAEFLDCPAASGGGAGSNAAPAPADYGFTVLGRRSSSAVTALAVMVPEPTAGALGMAALGSLAALGRSRRMRRAR